MVCVIDMNIFQLFSVLCLFVGVVLGSIFGYRGWGVLGAFLGLPIGLGGGYFFSVVVLFLLALLFKIMLGGPFFAPKHAPDASVEDETGT